MLAGLDIAQEAAKQQKFPEVSKPEQVESLDVRRTIDLAYYMGLLSRPEWRRLLHHFYDPPPTINHYERVTGS